MESQANKKRSLLDLPPELRLMIYEYLPLVNLWYGRLHYVPSNNIEASILGTCHLIRCEAYPIFLRNKFLFRTNLGTVSELSPSITFITPARSPPPNAYTTILPKATSIVIFIEPSIDPALHKWKYETTAWGRCGTVTKSFVCATAFEDADRSNSAVARMVQGLQQNKSLEHLFFVFRQSEFRPPCDTDVHDLARKMALEPFRALKGLKRVDYAMGAVTHTQDLESFVRNLIEGMRGMQ